ncbi:efflux RND transporter permease subunit [Scleromatobacter humisilvae]|uniref:Efflux RND transporter permease subunit n=1 Tax=Scleromatobacter humisilvae TaxID=2897159 RepID=A0A9X2C100_9BURK|nr:efflux RND transporter permease subunit [Scleromatobacter humisilvae]MCK9684440.1 efflux RND transporter permease subunit [Scleromatobacter humisilvae]
MFLSDFSIKRPVAALVIVITLMGLGLIALNKLRVNQIPDVDQPVMVVSITYPGASPDTVEREIVNRIERAMQGIEGVDQSRSSSTASEGQAQFVLVFDFHKDMTQASDEIRNAIGTVRYKLPVEMREPVLTRIDPSAQPIMQIALSSQTMSHAEISRLAEDQLADRFRALPGVATVNVNGSLTRELSVLLHAQKLREFGVSVTDVVNALRAQNATAPVGKVRGTLEDQSIRLVGRFESPAEFNQMLIKRSGDNLIRLGQVATVQDGFAEMAGYNERNGRANVGLSVTRTREGSTVTIAKEVRELVETINKEQAGKARLEVTQDGGNDAQDSLDNVIHSLFFGAGLTILVVYVFLNSWRSTLITGLSLPTSVITAFIAVWLCGFTLNFMSLLGLSLAIGVLIDDAIVVRENIVRHMQRGEDRRTAALNGTAEIGMAVASTTFSIVAVFAPVAFIPGITGEWFRPFGLTVVASVIVSLFISFTLDPMLSAYWGDPVDLHDAPRKGIGRYLQRFNDWFDHQADRYSRIIEWALHHRWYMGWAAFLSFVLAIALQMGLGGSDFLPKSDSGTLAVDIRMPPSASLDYARMKLDEATALARTLPETVATNAWVNPAQGRIYVDIGKSTQRKRNATEVGEDLRKLMSRLVGAEYVVLDDLNNGAQKPVQIRFHGTDSRQLLAITNDFMDKLRKVKGAVDVGLSEQDPQQELRIDLDRGLANSMGVSINDAAQSLRVAFAGVEAGDWVDPTGEARDVAVRLAPEDRVDASNIERLPIAVAGSDRMVPLEQIATVTMGKAPSKIQHANSKRMMVVAANAQGRSSGEVTADAMKIARAIQFPPGFGIELTGASHDQQEVFSNLGIALVSGVALMYLVLVMQFGSFTAPIPVMISLPLSLIGVVIALVSTHGTLNLMSIIGVIMLMGLVAKNAILLLDAARAEEREGMDREEALMHAGRKRLRPIMMTTFALIAGMLPVAIGLGEGGEFYRPMAVTIIGGTITSTMLTLLVIPCFYDSIEMMRERMLAKFHRRSERFTAVGGFVLTLLEFFAFLATVRFFWRAGRRALGLPTGGLWRRSEAGAAPVSPAAPSSEPVFNP